MAATNNDIFQSEGLRLDAGQITANLSINKNSAIFNGHFPWRPIVPGACMVQLIKDTLELALDTRLVMKKAANIKFISMITPENTLSASVTIGYKISADDLINVNAQIFTGQVICFKMQASYSKV
jgi:3-hydroxyacyl-[acyl-carrier-protein] dehydratase